jgi:C-terminal processing protease CtpA/Prc
MDATRTHGQGTSQTLSKDDRGHAIEMLRKVKDDLKKNYIDPNFKGIDLDDRCREAEEKIQQATSHGQLWGVIAQVLLDFDDPNTWFWPPYFMRLPDFGFDWLMVGEAGYITAINPGSDAEAKGLKVGDLVHSIGGYKPLRANSWQLKYGFTMGRPQQQLNLVVQSPEQDPRKITVKGQLVLDKKNIDIDRDASSVDRLMDKLAKSTASILIQPSDDLVIIKIGADVDDTFKKLLGKTRNISNLILDLRGLAAGSQEASEAAEIMCQIIGYFFDRDVKFADVKTRKGQKPLLAKSKGGRTYKGKLIVLVDSQTKGPTELFARVIQLEKRGLVIGDSTRGAIRFSTWNLYPFATGTISVSICVSSITTADLLMSDGQSLEGKGVTPDEVVLPTQADLAVGRDPVLAYAAKLLGTIITPEKAGNLFPKTNYTLWLQRY